MNLEPLYIPESKQSSAYLTLLVTILANLQSIRFQLADIQSSIEHDKTMQAIFELYEKRMNELGEELKVQLYAKFGE